MKHIIREYKETMDQVEVRSSFEEETLQLLQDAGRVSKRKKKIKVEWLGNAAATLFAALLLGAGTVAVAAELSLPEQLRSLFGDSISAEKVENGEYQQLAERVSVNGKSLRSLGVVGDEETTLLMLEFEISKEKLDERNSENIAFGIRTYDDKVNRADYIPDICQAMKLEDGDGTYRYMMQYEIPVYWANYSRAEGKEILVEVQSMILNYQKQGEEQIFWGGFTLPVTLNDEFFAEAKDVQVNQSTKMAGREVTVEYMRFSEYRTKLYIYFPADNAEDAISFWKSSRNQIEFYHNGEKVDFAEEYQDYCPGNMEGLEAFGDPGLYGCILPFETVGFEEDDTFEIRWGDSVIMVE